MICTTVVVALSILLGGSSLVCLNRGSWAHNDQIQEENAAEDLVTEVEPENQTLFEPVTPSGDLNKGTFSYGDHLTETFIHVILMALNKYQVAKYNSLVINIKV